MNVTGTIYKVMETKTFGKFTKREFVIETSEKYPQKILMEVTNDNVNLLDNLKTGDVVECGINLRGRDWTSPSGEVKFFNSIVCWTMKLMDDERSNEAAFKPKEYAKKEADKMFETDIANSYDPEDDLPF
jgi:hypothetical protein